jgi:hypothetical protein
MVLNWPEVELLAITYRCRRSGKRAGLYALRLGVNWPEDIPVAVGADISLGCYSSKPGLPDQRRYWPEPIPSAPTLLDQALSLLEHSIEEGATVAAIGPTRTWAFLVSASRCIYWLRR